MGAANFQKSKGERVFKTAEGHCEGVLLTFIGPRDGDSKKEG